MAHRLLPHLGVALITGLMLLGTVFVPRTVSSHDEMAAVRLGYPWSFAVQDQSALDPPSFPREQAFLSPLEFPVRIQVERAALAFGVVFAAIESLFLVWWRAFNSSMEES